MSKEECETSVILGMFPVGKPMLKGKKTLTLMKKNILLKRRYIPLMPKDKSGKKELQKLGMSEKKAIHPQFFFKMKGKDEVGIVNFTHSKKVKGELTTLVGVDNVGKPIYLVLNDAQIISSKDFNNLNFYKLENIVISEESAQNACKEIEAKIGKMNNKKLESIKEFKDSFK